MDVDEFAALLRGFDGRREIVKAMRRALTRAAKATVIPKIRANALAQLPSAGGLNEWTAAARITPTIRYGSRMAGINLRGSRRSLHKKSQLESMDYSGLLRAPSWGRRGRGDWHFQVVKPEWFTRPAAADGGFPRAVEAEVDRVKDQLR